MNPGVSKQHLEAPVPNQRWEGNLALSPRRETSNTSLAVWVWILGVRFQTFSAGVGAGWRAKVLPAQSGSFCFKERAKLGENLSFSAMGWPRQHTRRAGSCDKVVASSAIMVSSVAAIKCPNFRFSPLPQLRRAYFYCAALL